MKRNRRMWVLCLLMFTVQSCSVLRYSRLKKQGNEVIAKVEAFRDAKDRLPEILGGLGIKETEKGPIYYRKLDDDHFELWFGIDLGESVTCDSESKKWSP